MRWRAATGVEFLVLDRPSQPLFTVSYGHRGGAQFDPGSQRGLASFTAALVDEGTKRRSASQLQDEIEGRGGFLGAGSGWDCSEVGLTVLIEHIDFAVELITEIVCEPAFDTGEVERARMLRLSEIDRRRNEPDSLAAERLSHAIYGEGVYRGPVLGDSEVIERLTAADLACFWQAQSAAAASYVLAAGDLRGVGIEQRLEAAFARLADRPAPDLPEIATSPLDRTVVHIVDRPQAAQTELRIGHLGVPRRSPDRPALILLNALLGGKFTSWINLNLRERHGFTYGARSQFTDRRGRGLFVVSAAVETPTAGAACREVLGELRRARDEPIPEQEIEDTRSYVLGVFPYSLQSLSGLVDRLEQIALYDLEDDYYSNLLESIRTVTGDQVGAAARAHLDPEAVAIVAVGPARELEAQLDELGPVEVHTGS